jgi:hypothetical protein
LVLAAVGINYPPGKLHSGASFCFLQFYHAMDRAIARREGQGFIARSAPAIVFGHVHFRNVVAGPRVLCLSDGLPVVVV